MPWMPSLNLRVGVCLGKGWAALGRRLENSTKNIRLVPFGELKHTFWDNTHHFNTLSWLKLLLPRPVTLFACTHDHVDMCQTEGAKQFCGAPLGFPQVHPILQRATPKNIHLNAKTHGSATLRPQASASPGSSAVPGDPNQPVLEFGP